MAENIQKVILTADDQTKAAFESFRASVKGALGSTDALKKSASLLKAGLGALGVTLGAQFFADLSRRSLEFDKSLQSLSTQLGSATEKVAEFESASKNLALQFGTQAIEQSAAFYEILSAGITDTTEATNLLTAANKLAIGGNANLATSIDGLTSIIKGYGGAAGTAADISDTLFTASLAGKISIQELSEGIGRAVPLAEVLGVSFDELTAGVSALTLGGISARESITGMRAILASVARPSSEAAELAGRLGLEFNSAGIKAKGFAGFMADVKARTGGSTDSLAVLFGGVEALVPALALTGQAGAEFSGIMDQMAGKAGAAEEAFNKMAEAPGFKIDKLMASVNAIALTLGDTLSGVLAPAAEKAARFLNELFGSIKPSALEQQSAKITELTSKIESMTNRTHVPLIGGLLFDKKEFDLLQHQLQMAKQDYADLSKVQESEVVTQKRVTETVDTATGVLTTHTKARKAEVSESQKFLDKLELESAQLGKTSLEIRKMEAARLGLSSVADPLIDQIEQETAAAKQLEAQLKKVESITQANMTADERFSETITDLNQLMQLPDGGLSVETYNRAVQKAQDELQSSMDSTKAAGRQAADEWNDIWRTSENTARMAFTAFAAHGTSAMESIGQSIKTAIIDVLYQLTVRKWVINLGTSFGLGDLPGGKSSAGGKGMDIANIGLSGANLLKTGFGATGMIGRGISAAGRFAGSGSIAAFGAGMGVTGTQAAAQAGASTLWGASGASTAASMGASFAAAAGPAIALFAVDQIGRLLAGDKTLKGFDKIPVLGGFLAAMFGRGPLKQRDTVLSGIVGSEGFESGTLGTNFRAKGGLFRSNKNDFARVDLITGQVSTDNAKLMAYAEGLSDVARGLTETINQTVSGFSESVTGFAQNLGLSTDAVDNYSKQIELKSEKGKQIPEEAVAEMLSGVSNEMAEGILPIVKTLKKAGEDSFAALARLNTEYTTLVDAAASVLGKSVSDARAMISGASFEGRTGFVDASGGVDALTQQVQFFAANFLTAAEVLAPAQEKLNEGLGKLGFSTDLTREQFKGLVQSFGDVGGVSEETLQSLLKLQTTFVEVRNAQDLLTESTRELAQESRKTALSNLLQTQQQREGLETRLLQAEGNTVELRKRELEALAPLNRGLLLSIFNREDSNRISSERIPLENQFLQLTGNTVELRKRELEALYPLNRKLKESIFALEDARTAAANAQTEVDGAFGALQRAVEGQRKSLTEDYNASLKNINISIADVTSQVGKLKGLSDLLGSALDTLRSISFQEASKQIQSAIESARAGNFVNAEDIKSAVSGLTQIREDRFDSRLDFQRAQAQSANQLGELSKLTGKELTLQERTLSALNDRATRLEEEFNLANQRLDQVVTEAQTQINVLRGIDTSVLSVAAAVNALQIKIQSAASAAGVVAALSVGGGGGISVSSVDNPIAPINSPAGQNSPINIPSSIIGATQQQPGASKISDVDIRTFFATSRTPEEIALAAIENNVSSSRIAGIMNFSQDQVDTFFRDNPNIPKFASGTSFVPRTGPAIVHQGERIINPEQNRDLIRLLEQLVRKIADGNADTSELLRVLRSMRAETDDGFAIRNQVAT